MKIEYDRKILSLISVAINIFLVAFIIGRLSMPVPMQNPNFMFDQHNRMPPPPPPPSLFSPADLFTPQEMQENFSGVEDGFNKIYLMRRDFIEQLKKDKITKAEILLHLNNIDNVMSGLKNKMQEKAADKIITMSKQQREEFIKRISAQ